MMKKSVSSYFSNIFITLNSISADICLKYTPCTLDSDFKKRINDYIMASEKNLNLLLPDEKKTKSVRTHTSLKS